MDSSLLFVGEEALQNVNSFEILFTKSPHVEKVVCCKVEKMATLQRCGPFRISMWSHSKDRFMRGENKAQDGLSSENKWTKSILHGFGGRYSGHILNSAHRPACIQKTGDLQRAK